MTTAPTLTPELLDETALLGDRTHYAMVTCKTHHAICGARDLATHPIGYDNAVTCPECVQIKETGDHCLGCGNPLPPWELT